MPGIVRSILPDKQKAEQLKGFVLEITQKALERLKQMRAAEGRALAADLEVHCQAMRMDLENILSIQTTTGAEYAKKLKKRIDELLTEAKVELDEETLAREVAIFVDRTDISEEIARLQSHLSQFTESCNGDGQAGRRLDFL
ncbi:MAG: endoribonuclease YicC domain-containing protein, partial [Planctomycetota bacterium]